MTTRNDAYSIGTTIFVPRVWTTKSVEVECPDCRGEKKWIISTPSGMRQEIDCPRCDGGQRDWLKPKRIEVTTTIDETVIASVSISERKDRDDGETFVRITYDGSPYTGTISHERAFLTREAAELEAERLLAESEIRENAEWKRDRENANKRAGVSIVQALNEKAFEKYNSLDAKVTTLRERMLDAIRHPGLDGPKLSRPLTSYGQPELTPEALATWLNGLLEEAELEGWTEEELHEATCHC